MEQFRFVAGETPFASAGWPALAVACYLLVAAALPRALGRAPPGQPGGPGSPPALRLFEISHNGILVLLSLSMMLGSAHAILRRVSDEGGLWAGFLCSQRHRDGKGLGVIDGEAGFWIYVYHLSKYYELLDTVILILKRKDIIPLHLWHHGSMVFVTFAWLRYPLLEGSLYCVFANSLTHVFMYWYYLLTLLEPGKRVWWKRHLTQGQIVQLWSGMGVCACFLGAKALAGDGACAGHTGSCLLSVAVNASFVVLFSRFYGKSYSGKGKAS